MELIEYQRRETIQKDFQDERGEGLHNILFKVNNLEKTLDKFKAKGIDVLQEGSFFGGGGLAYIAPTRSGVLLWR